MIFITIGTQAPFDRLIRALDECALAYKDHDFIAQVIPSDYEIKNMKVLGFIPPKEFDRYISEADLIISHAGMGTILSSLTKGKPLLIFPRLAKYHEHRNDHQLATATKFQYLNYVYTAFDTEELKAKLAELIDHPVTPLHHIGRYAPANFIEAIKKEIESGQ